MKSTLCRSRRKEALFVCIALAFIGCSHGALAATFTVSMRNFSFSPSSLTINVGDTVTWTDQQGNHDTVSGVGGVPSGVWSSNNQYHRLMSINETFSFTFNTPGTFPYYCTPHWTFGMIGTIRVVAPNARPTVSITSPTNGASFSAPADITIDASASDSDGTVTQVQFRMNGSPIGTDSVPPYTATVNNLGPGNYTFTATATDNAGATATNSVTVTVSGQQPAITNPPQSQTVTAGSDITFTVQATGTPPLNYQWFFGPTAINGATGSSLLLTNVSSADSGTYTIQVANSFGSASASATLTVTNMGIPPSFTTQPQSQTVNEGTNVTFIVDVIGSAPLTFQWFFGNAPIANATNALLVLSNVTAANAGDYFAVVTNDFGFAISSNATLTVNVCEYALSKDSAVFVAAGGADAIDVITSPNCSWTVDQTNTWILITSPTSGVGPGTVNLIVLSNSTRTARSGILLIAGKTFTVTQAGFVFPVRNDFNHDGQTDLLWQSFDGRLRLWFMNGLTRVRSMLLRNGKRVAPGWEVVGSHDFNSDGSEDILWQHSTGRLAVWFMNGTNLVQSQLISRPPPGPLWRVVGIGDFNHDGQADFLFRHRNGYLLVWFMNGATPVRQSLLYNGNSIAPLWRIVGVADVNNDGQVDIIWQGPDSSIVVWFMDGTNPVSGPFLSNLPRSNARIVGLNDLDQDGHVDFIWRRPDGRLLVWLMDGTNRLDSLTVNNAEPLSSTYWKLVSPKK
jgi:plastocyanin